MLSDARSGRVVFLLLVALHCHVVSAFVLPPSHRSSMAHHHAGLPSRFLAIRPKHPCRGPTMLMSSPLDLLKVYEFYLHKYPHPVDTMTGMALYVLGKVTCDAINKQPWRQKREYGRWAFMGCLDGYFTHAWYWYIEMAASGLQPLLKLSSMVLTSSFLYTPVYCLAFLVVMGVLEGRRASGVVDKVKKGFFELTSMTIRTWMPLNLILFGVVPLQLRVSFSMACHYLYLIALAMWESGLLSTFIARVRDRPQQPHKFQPVNLPAVKVVVRLEDVDQSCADPPLIRAPLSADFLAGVPLPEEMPLSEEEEKPGMKQPHSRMNTS